MRDPDPPAPGEKSPEGAAAGSGPKDQSERPASDLSPEEQMARFEESLKDADWGHQPC